jgi:hypothetical protein
LTCCCDWNALKGLTNRCDYRRRVSAGADLRTCRDANEDHGSSFEGSCAAHAELAFDDPASRTDGQCWSVDSFADPEAAGIETLKTDAGDDSESTDSSSASATSSSGGASPSRRLARAGSVFAAVFAVSATTVAFA